mgnify:FL=1
MVQSECMQQPDLNDLDTIRLQVAQSLIEHEIVAQALRAQALVSAGFVLVLGLLALFMWRHTVRVYERSLADTKRYYSEQSEREKRHSSELIEQQKQNGLELNSITRTQWAEFAAAVWTKRSG